MANLEVFFLDKTFNGSTCPSVPNATIPFTFESPIPVNIELELTYTDGSHNYKRTINTNGNMTAYSTNGIYPCVALSTVGYYSSYYQIGCAVNGSTASFVGTSIVNYYKDDVLQNTQTYTNSLEGFIYCSGRTYEADSCKLRVLRCSLPIIFAENNNKGGDLYTENPDIYFYSNVSGTTRMPSITAGYDYTKVLNVGPQVVPVLTEYFYKGWAYEYTVDEFGTATRTSNPPIYRGFKVKTQSRCSLYEIAGIDNGVLKMGMNLQDVEIAYYSTDGGDTWQNMAGSPTSLPFDYVYRNWKNEIGTFYCYSVNDADIDTNMFIFETEEESDEYNDGGTNEKDATNYNIVSTGQEPKNNTGEEDTQTTFGVVGVRSIFSQQYILNTSALSEVANALFDITQGGITGIFEDIKKGCEMYGDSVVDDIENLSFYPVNLNTVFANNISSQNYIYFGGYKFDMTNSVNKIVYPNGYYDFGSFTLETTFGDNIRSYEPYTKLYCYLAYIGWVQLDMKKYLHKTVNIRYYIDTRTGGCVACLIANGILIDYFNGQIGVSMPIKATDFNAYANAQIQTLLGFGKGIAGQGQNVANVGHQMSSAGASMGELAVGGVAVAGVGASIQGTKTLYGLTQNNINNFNHTIGGSSSMLNMFLPQECMFMFEVQEAMPTEYERELVGLPSNASGSVGSFTGYLECEQVNLVCSGATAKEQAEIIRYLYNGVYI